jgi:hypothetical protein
MKIVGYTACANIIRDFTYECSGIGIEQSRGVGFSLGSAHLSE